MSRWCLGVALLILTSSAFAEPQKFVIFHSSDIHGALASRPARWHPKTPQRRVGGFAALASLVKLEKQPYLLLDSGDIFQGTPEGNLTKGRAIIEAMNAVGYHAMAVGNHEYDYGEDNLIALSRLAKFPMLGANIRRKKDLRQVKYAGARRLMTVGKLRVGIIGIATRHTKTSTLPKNVAHLVFEDEVATARRHAEWLRKKGADVIVVLSHCGLAPSVARKRLDPRDLSLTDSDKKYVGDLAIARGAPVDIVLGGHMHTGLTAPWRDPKSGVVIVQSYEGLASVTRLEVVVDKNAQPPVRVVGRLIDLWVDELGEDPKVLALVKRYQNSVSQRLSQKVGTLKTSMLRAGHPLDNPLGSWMADVMRIYSAADIAVQNTFGIRDDLLKGDITLRDIYRVMPFENTVVVVTLTGLQLKKLIRDNLREFRSGLQISGLEVHMKATSDGKRLEDIELIHKGEPIVSDKHYRVATNNFLAQGGTGGAVMKDAPMRDTGRKIRSVLVEAVKQHTPIHPPPVGRFRRVD
jgi:2',3'-cyclic-nucleotide 2'-phosphodiesterase (5'-nucleotidase family)